MAAWRYEISLLVLKKYFTRSLRSLVKHFSTLEEKFLISARPCNILEQQGLKLKQHQLENATNGLFESAEPGCGTSHRIDGILYTSSKSCKRQLVIKN